MGRDENDRAVSTVIGSILMVALSVILATVVGAFVLGSISNQGQTPFASVELNQSSSSVVVTVVQPGNLDTIEIAGDVTSTTGGANWGSASSNALVNDDVSTGDSIELQYSTSGGSFDATTSDVTGDRGTVQIIGTVSRSEALIDSIDYKFN